MPKISELNTLTGLTNDDLLVVVNDPGGSPSTNKITFSNFSNSIFSNASSRTILPVSGNTQDLGSATKPWKNIYIGNGALYVDGTAISTPGTGTIMFVDNEMKTISNNANLSISTRGTGKLLLSSNNYVWDFSPEGILNAPAGAQIKFSDNTVITNITGPYVNDGAAGSGGVALKSLYYDSSGNVKIRLT